MAYHSSPHAFSHIVSALKTPSPAFHHLSMKAGLKQLCNSLYWHRAWPNLQDHEPSTGKRAELFKDTVLAKQNILCIPGHTCPQIHPYPSLLYSVSHGPQPCSLPLLPHQLFHTVLLVEGSDGILENRREGKGQALSPHFPLAQAVPPLSFHQPKTSCHGSSLLQITPGPRLW